MLEGKKLQLFLKKVWWIKKRGESLHSQTAGTREVEERENRFSGLGERNKEGRLKKYFKYFFVFKKKLLTFALPNDERVKN